MSSLADLQRAKLLDELGLDEGAYSQADLELMLADRVSRIGPRKYDSGRYFFPEYFGTFSTNAVTTGTIYFVPFVVHDYVTVDQICVEVTTGGAGSSVHLGLYDTTEDGRPGDKIVAPASVSDGATIANIASDIDDIELAPGLYWGAVVSVAGSPSTMRGYAAGVNPNIMPTTWSGSGTPTYYTMTGQTSLPATANASVAAGTGIVPRMALRIV